MPDESTPNEIVTGDALTEQFRLLRQMYPTPKCVKGRPNLSYVHERLYRAVSGVVVSNKPYRERLANVHVMLAPARPSDVPRELRDAFMAITTTPALTMREVDAEAAVRDVVELYLSLSERVVHVAALRDGYERDAWVVMQARERRPEPFVALLKKLAKQGQPPHPRMLGYLTRLLRGQHEPRGGRDSLHPARVIAIARMVKNRLESQRLHDVRTSMNATCKDLAPLLCKSWESVKAAYLDTYSSH